MRTGFIGLGHLGKTMAKRLTSENVPLIVWNRTREKAMDMGCKIAEHPASLISVSDVVLVNLFDSAAVEDVLTGKNGLLKGDRSGKIIIDTSTNHFSAAVRFHTMVRDAGAEYLEAPVLGSVIPASRGALTMLVSGNDGPFDAVRPMLEKLSKKIFFLKQLGMATKMKLINNLVLGAFMASIAEGVAYGERIGLDRGAVLDILDNGAGSSMVLTGKKEKLLNGDFSPHFSSALIHKDLHYLHDLARELKAPLFCGSLVKELFAMTFGRGEEGLDFSAVYRVFSER